MVSAKLKEIDFSGQEVIDAFNAIGNAVDESEANFRKEGSNRVEEDLRIMRTVFRARAIIEDIQEQLRPWANAFGFNPQDPEEVKLSWSLTVGKAVGICMGLQTELAPGWQSRGRIGSNNPNTVEGLIEALDEINSANLDGGDSSARPAREQREDKASAAELAPGELPMPKGMSEAQLKPRPHNKDTDKA